MSRHHRAQKWTTYSEHRRATLAQMLPLPCIHCGRPVMPDPPGTKRTRWHVGHVRDAAAGGRPVDANTGPVHAKCNLEAGGRAGAAAANARRARARQEATDPGFRPW